VKGTTLPAGDGQLQYTRLEPLGVVAAIVPWNSPLLIAGFKIPAALAAGNTMVLKAAEDAPLSLLDLAEICAEHLPPGVLNVLSGEGRVAGAALVDHPGVDKVSFTGSTEVGRGVARAAGGRLVPASLELGRKNPSIVCPDSLDDDLIDGLLLSTRFHRQGQSCTAGSRLFLHEDVHDEVVDRLVAKLGALVVGDPLDEATDMGTVINEKQFGAIAGYVDDGRAEPEMTAVLGGAAPSNGPLTEGLYHVPTVFTGARNDFYGLAAYVWSHDLDQALTTAHRLETGWVQVNQGGGQVVGQSYSGYKDSGLGREASLEGMLAGFTRPSRSTSGSGLDWCRIKQRWVGNPVGGQAGGMAAASTRRARSSASDSRRMEREACMRTNPPWTMVRMFSARAVGSVSGSRCPFSRMRLKPRARYPVHWWNPASMRRRASGSSSAS
jgi:aldehyde dehydrogenase (NAD+)